MDNSAREPSTTVLASAALWAAVSSGAAALVTLLRSKVTAVELGPEGVGAVAEILQFATLAITPVMGVFLGPALLRRVAAARTLENVRPELATAWTWSLVSSVLLSVCAVVFAPFLLAFRNDTRLFLAAGMLTAASGFASQFAIQVANARLQYRKASIINCCMLAVVCAGVVAGTLLDGLRGQFIGFALASLLAIPLVWALARAKPPPLSFRLETADRQFLGEAVRLGIAGLTGNLLIQVAVIGIRLRLARSGGEYEVGQFQAAWTVGQTYFAVVLAALGSYVFPRFARAAAGDELRAEVSAAARFVLAQALPLILILIAIRGPVLTAIFSRQFSEASEILGIQLAGDAARGLGAVFVGCLLFRGHAAAVFAVEVLGAATLLAAFVLLQPVLGAPAAGYAQVAMSLVYLPLSALTYARATRHRPPVAWLALALLSVPLLVAANELVRRVPSSAWAVFAAGFIAALFSPMARRLLAALRPVDQRRGE